MRQADAEVTSVIIVVLALGGPGCTGSFTADFSVSLPDGTSVLSDSVSITYSSENEPENQRIYTYTPSSPALASFQPAFLSSEIRRDGAGRFAVFHSSDDPLGRRSGSLLTSFPDGYEAAGEDWYASEAQTISFSTTPANCAVRLAAPARF